MNRISFKKILVILLGFGVLGACEDKFTEMNTNPNGIAPEAANPNLLMTTVLASAAQNYLDLGFNDMAGTMQHTQKNGWFGGHNHYDWGARDWSGWYGIQRNNALLQKRAEDLGYDFFRGVSLTMKAFIFGNIADLWGDAPYTDAVKGDQNANEFKNPKFDSQETIYMGVIEDLKEAAAIFASTTNEGVTPAQDLYFGGSVEKWHRFANSLLLRYYLRISEKKSEVSKPGIESVYNSGMYITSPSDDATLAYTGGANDVWPSQYTDVTSFTRWQACQTFIDQLVGTSDPRLSVWFAPVNVQWVADAALPEAAEEFIRADGVLLDGVKNRSYLEYRDNTTIKYTRKFNPNEVQYDDNEYVGLPPGLPQPAGYNGNPIQAQGGQNQHVSQLNPMYSYSGGSLLKARLISAAEVSFILAESALKGYSVGSAQTHYENGIKHSLTTWGKAGDYDTFIAEAGVAYDAGNALEQIITQKWVASWTAATEAWMDFKRTGLPALTPGPAAAEDVLPVRFRYGNDEWNNNRDNVQAALTSGGLKVEGYNGGIPNADTQWSKTWVLQNTGKPW